MAERERKNEKIRLREKIIARKKEGMKARKERKKEGMKARKERKDESKNESKKERKNGEGGEISMNERKN